jgi:hypothetical protein
MIYRTLFIAAIATLLLSGCYTQFSTLDPYYRPQEQFSSPDSASDSTIAASRVDTIVVKEREHCFWERDLLGYPRLRCYESYYHRDWFLYNRTPWWYRSDPYWFDYNRCPRYYYYDRDCGCCRYHSSHHHHYYGGKPGGSTPVSPGSAPRERSGGISSGKITETTGDQLKKTGENKQENVNPGKSVVPRARSSGILVPENAKKVEQPVSEPQKKVISNPPVQESEQKPAPVYEPEPSKDSNQDSPRSGRRNPRSW